MLFKNAKVKKVVSGFLSLKTANTQRAYNAVIAQFIEVAGGGIGGLAAANEQHVIRFIGGLKVKGLADQTIEHRLNLIKSLFSLLVDCGFRTDNPAKKLARFLPINHQEQRRPTKLIDFNLVRKILDAPPANTRQGVVDRAVLAIMFFGGLRRSEVAALTLADIVVDAEELYLVIRGAKSGAIRRQVLNATISGRVALLVAQRKADGGEADSRLIVRYNTYGQPSQSVSDYWIYRRFKHYSKGYACHSARATAATLLLEHGCDYRAVQLFLGHKASDQVKVYDKRRISLANHPGKQIKY